MEFQETHLSIKINNLEKSLNFYNKILGIPILYKSFNFEGINKDINGKKILIGQNAVVLNGIELVQKNKD